MLQVICGFVVGLLLAGLGFGLAGGGVPGLIVAVVLAALGYIAASTLTEPERRIGKMGAIAVFVGVGSPLSRCGSKRRALPG